jgi:hypothetical protein
MTDGKEVASESLILSAIKREMLTHELSIGEGELGLQPVPLAYPKQVGLPASIVSTAAYYY